jgi:DNA-binding XRE family transcriptional regulator
MHVLGIDCRDPIGVAEQSRGGQRARVVWHVTHGSRAEATQGPARASSAPGSNLVYNAGYAHKLAVTYLMRRIPEARRVLASMGRRLRRARLDRNDTMATFAQRIGVSERTMRAMERGLPTVQIGTWLDALSILDELHSVDHLLEPRESLLDRARREQSGQQRQRASRRRS